MSNPLPIILHIGGPKTGTSALQYELTWNPIRTAFGLPGVQYEYVALQPQGLLRQSDLADFASSFAAMYANSSGLEQLVAQPVSIVNEWIAELREMRESGIIPILSYEVWLYSPPDVIAAFTSSLDAPVHAVAYVRPPVQWLNSIYWHKDETETRNNSDWIASTVPMALWSEFLCAWKSSPNVERVDVRLMGQSVTRDFYNLLQCEESIEVRHNASLPNALNRFILRNHLTTQISVAELKFAWWRWAQATKANLDQLDFAQYFQDPADLSQIIDATLESSMVLLDHCAPDVREQMEQDLRWWSVDPVVHAPKSAPRSCIGSSESQEETILTCTLQSLMAADAAWREVSMRLRHCQKERDELRAQCDELKCALASIETPMLRRVG